MYYVKVVVFIALYFAASAAQAVEATIEYPHNEWVQKSSPIKGATVSDLLTPEVTEQVGSWALFIFDAEINQYISLSSGDELLAGEGFWAIQVTGSDVVASLSGDGHQKGSSIVGHDAGYYSSYAKLGNPYSGDFNVSEITFHVGEAVLSFAEAAGVYHDGSIDAWMGGTYVSLTAGDVLPVSQGFWIEFLVDDEVIVKFGDRFGRPPAPPVFNIMQLLAFVIS